MKKTLSQTTESGWLYIPEIDKEVEIEVHDKNKSWDDLAKQYPNFEEQLLTREECEKILENKEASKTLKMDGSSSDDDFYIQQFNTTNKAKGYVAVLYVVRGRSYFDSDWDSRGADSCRGVRFCRKKIDSLNKELEFIQPEKRYVWRLDDSIEINLINCDNHREAFDKLSKFLLDIKAKRVEFSKGYEIYE